MQVNLTSDFLKMLGADLSAQDFAESVTKLVIDQILKGEVLRVFPNGNAQIKLEGQTVFAKPNLPLIAGQTVTAKVEQVVPIPVLKLVGNTSTDGQKTTPSPTDSNTGQTSTNSSASDASPNQTTVNPNPVVQRSDQTTLSQNAISQQADQSSNSNGLATNQVLPNALLTNTDLKSLNLQSGQVVNGTVSQVIDNSTVAIQSNGQTLTAKVPITTPNADGTTQPAVDTATLLLQSLDKSLTQSSDAPLPSTVLTQNPLSAGDTVSAKVEQVANGYVLVVQPKNADVSQLKVIEPSMIKPYLPAKQPFGEMVDNLQNTIVNNPVLSDLKIDPQLLANIKNTLSLLLSDNPTPDANTLKNQVAQSGANYEAKVKNALTEGADGTIKGNKEVLVKDLKGQLLQLGKDIEKVTAGADPSLPAPVAGRQSQQASNVLQTIKQATDNIELNQLTNQFAKQENQPILLQIPYQQSDTGKTVSLYVKNQGGGNGGKPGDKQNYSLVFLLDMSSLGNMRVDTQVTNNKLSIKIGAENQSVVDFIQSHTADLKNQLQQIGFSTDVSCTKQKPEDMQVVDRLTPSLAKDPFRLVDIKT